MKIIGGWEEKVRGKMWERGKGGEELVTLNRAYDKTRSPVARFALKMKEAEIEAEGGVASLTIREQCLESDVLSVLSPPWTNANTLGEEGERVRRRGRGKGRERQASVIFFTGTLPRDRRDSIDLREKLLGQPLTLSPLPLRNGFRNRIRIPLPTRPVRPVRHPTDIPCTFELERERERDKIPKEETGIVIFLSLRIFCCSKESLMR